MKPIINYPVFGTLVPDQWNEDLLTFREFSCLRAFWHPDREACLSSSYLPANHRQWVEDWQAHTAELSNVCRNAPVHAALQSLGVYEVSVAVDGNDVPAASQEAAFRYICDHEQETFDNVLDALHRYYRFARENLSDWFDEDYPDDPTLEQLACHLDFDGVLISRSSSNELSALRLAWDPSWDPEHGFLMAVYKSQVIAIGTDDVDDVLQSPAETAEAAWEGMWGREQMTAAELNAYHAFAQGHELPDDASP